MSAITYTKTQFTTDFANSTINVDESLLKDVDKQLVSQNQNEQVRNEVRTTLLNIAGEDGVISGTKELDEVFKLLDKFDKNGSGKSFIESTKDLLISHKTLSGKLLDTMKDNSLKADVLTSNEMVDKFAGSTINLIDIHPTDVGRLLANGMPLHTLIKIADGGKISTPEQFQQLFDKLDAKNNFGEGVISTAEGKAGDESLKATDAGEVIAILSKYCKKAQTISRKDFISSNSAGAFNLSKLSKSDLSKLEDLGLKSVLDYYGSSGTLQGEAALGALYAALDNIDKAEGDVALTKPIGLDAKPGVFDKTDAGKAMEILKSCFEISSFVAHNDLSRALVDPSVKEVHLDINNVTQPPKSKDCQKCSRQDITTTYKYISVGNFCSGNNTHCMAAAEDKSGNIKGSKQDFTDGRTYIDACLDAGVGVVVGTSYKDADYNNDGITDHFVCITGRGVDEEGRVYYSYNDPATKYQGTTGRFYVDQDTNMLFTGPFKRGANGTIINYAVSRVDPYTGVVTKNDGSKVDLSFKTVVGHKPALAFKK